MQRSPDVGHHSPAGCRATSGDWREKLLPLLEESVHALGGFFVVDRLDILAYPSFYVIPELGVNGYSEGPHLLHIKLDATSPHFAAQYAQAIPALVAHEVHHCMRGRTVGYGRTLAEALVSEGLACAFELQATGRLPFYAQALGSEQIALMLARAQAERHASTYDHAAWFYGSALAGIPRHTGYSLGYLLVTAALQQWQCTASDAVARPAADFFATQAI